jgi:thioredoxin reductase
MDIFDLIIIGAGPAGLSAGIYAQERKLKTIIIESDKAGGQLMRLYPDKKIFDYPSYSEITGQNLASKIIDHATRSGLKIIEDTSILDIKAEAKNFSVISSNKNYISKSIILATGMGHYESRHLGVNGEKEFQDKGIYYQKIPDKVIGKRIIVVGGGDVAIETALLAIEKGAYVTVVHRNEKFRAMEKTVDKIKSLRIPIYLSSQVKSIQGSDKLEHIEIIKNNGPISLLTADMLVVCIGTELNTTFLSNIKIKIDKHAAIINDDYQTSVTGIFACGDVVVPLGKFRRISVACGTAAIAVNGVYKYLKNPYWLDKC